MAYKKETIAKTVKELKRLVNDYREQIENGTISKGAVISCGNIKIGRVLNVSIAPIITCMNCNECKGYCYDVKACIQYGNVRNARAYNTALALYNREKYFSDIRVKLARRRKNKYFRWHVAGDILDMEYWIVNRYCDLNGKDAIPENLHIMYSKWDGLPMANPYKFPVFACRLKNGNVDTSDDWFARTFKCPGNCDICKEKKCGCIGGQDTYADEH